MVNEKLAFVHYEDVELQSDAYLLVVHSLCGVDHESVENSNVSQLWGVSTRECTGYRESCE